MESNILIQACRMFALACCVDGEERAQNSFMGSHVNINMQKFYFEPLLHAWKLHVGWLRGGNDCRMQTRQSPHFHIIISWNWITWCYRNPSCVVASILKPFCLCWKGQRFFLYKRIKEKQSLFHQTCSNLHIVFTHLTRLYWSPYCIYTSHQAVLISIL